MVSFAAQTNVVTLLEIQVCIVRCMRVPIRSLLLIHLDLSGILFFNYDETKDICGEGGGRKNFQMSKTFPRWNQDVEKSQDWDVETEASRTLAGARARTLGGLCAA